MLIAGPTAEPLWLTIIFAIHLLIFSALLWRRRQWRYMLLVLTFTLLLVAQRLPSLGMDVPLFGWSMVAAMRALAWFLGAIALLIVVGARLRERSK